METRCCCGRWRSGQFSCRSVKRTEAGVPQSTNLHPSSLFSPIPTQQGLRGNRGGEDRGGALPPVTIVIGRGFGTGPPGVLPSTRRCSRRGPLLGAGGGSVADAAGCGASGGGDGRRGRRECTQGDSSGRGGHAAAPDWGGEAGVGGGGNDCRARVALCSGDAGGAG